MSRFVRYQHPLLLSLSIWAVQASAQSTRPGWGATPYYDAGGSGVTFRVWAPNATSVYVPGQFNGWSTSATPLQKELTNGVWNGCWSADVTSASAGQQYKYHINYNGGSVWKQDPRARLCQYSGSGGNSIIYDPTAFNWSGDGAVSPALNDLVIYELHIGTFFTDATQSKFVAATNRLDYLKRLGVSAVEVMPIAEFPGDNSWGYNPAQPFAVENIGYGGPDGFKTFVKACHERGLAVLLDVVQNHYSQTDLEMWDFDGWDGGGAGGGIYFYQTSPQCCTDWGSRPNYSRQQVRDFIRQNFQMWLDEYHVDGFRWDTPHTMMYAGSTYIPEAATLITSINNFIHTNYPGKISIAEDVLGLGFDGAWDTTFPYVVTPILTNTVDADRDLNVLAYALANNLHFGGAASSNRVIFLESHDVVGDLNGTNHVRLVTAIDPATPNSFRARKLSLLGAALTFTAPGVPMIFQGQEMLENQQFSASRPVDWTKTNTYSGIVKCHHDLIALRRNFDGGTAGLKGDQINFLEVDNSNKLLVYDRWQNGNPTRDVVVIANLSGNARMNYPLPFPRTGNWYVHFNSDSTNYSGDFSNIGPAEVVASGASPAASLDIGPYSMLVLSQMPPTPSLVFAQTNGVGVVSWPASYSGWILQSTPSLPPLVWNTMSPSLYQTNGDVISVSISLSNPATLYRLFEN